MIFNSFTYLLFLSLVVVLYWRVSKNSKLLLLLSSSIIFYGFWNFYFVPLLFLSVGLDYTAALLLQKTEKSVLRKAILAVSVGVNLTLLGFFKYYYFFTENALIATQFLGITWDPVLLNIVLPIGISFYTFQSVSYTIDIYRRHYQPVSNFLLFANYVTFFPQLVAGPILRANEVIWQMERQPSFDLDTLKYGIARILGGIALKVLLADNIASFVNAGFAMDPALLSAIDVSTLAFLFGFQIYFDFAAYSHIAIGSALLMGIEFPENFNFPYHAKSPREFWRRWHISLSSWIRDYLYLPLMGLRVGRFSTEGLGHKVEISSTRAIAALFATWAIMGLWHGADWTFVFWGVWHALIIFTYRIVTKTVNFFSMPSFMYVFGSLLSIYFIMLGWISFRAEDTSKMLAMYQAFWDPSRWLYLGMRENTYLVAALTGLLVLIGPLFWKLINGVGKNNSMIGNLFLWMFATILIAVSLVYLRPLEQFIYFQF